LFSSILGVFQVNLVLQYPGSIPDKPCSPVTYPGSIPGKPCSPVTYPGSIQGKPCL